MTFCNMIILKDSLLYLRYVLNQIEFTWSYYTRAKLRSKIFKNVDLTTQYRLSVLLKAFYFSVPAQWFRYQISTKASGFINLRNDESLTVWSFKKQFMNQRFSNIFSIWSWSNMCFQKRNRKVGMHVEYESIFASKRVSTRTARLWCTLIQRVVLWFSLCL